MSKVKKTLEELLEEALVPEDEQPYEVPRNWVWVKLLDGGAYLLDNYRKPINANERANREGNIPYYGATGQVGWIDDYLTDEELVLLGEDGAPFFDLLKNKAYLIEGKAWVNNHAHILKSFYGHNGNIFLLHFLNQFNYHGYVNGTTRLKLTQGSMKSIPFPLPPHEEQKRIVDKIESLFSKLDEAKSLIEEAREGYEKRKASILAKAFRGELTKKWREDHPNVESVKSLIEKIIKDKETIYKTKNIRKRVNPSSHIIESKMLPKTWRWVRLDSLSYYITSGSRDWSKYYSDYGALFIRTQNINTNKLILDDVAYVNLPEKVEGKRSLIEHSDILTTITGANVGKCALIENEIPEAYVSQSVALTKLVRKDTAPFIYYSMLSPSAGGKELLDRAYGIGRPVLSLEDIRNILIPLPPLEEQKEIVHILDKLLEQESHIEELTQLEDQIESIKKSILDKAFKGQLGTNDPKEENAIGLLKKILKENS